MSQGGDVSQDEDISQGGDVSQGDGHVLRCCSTAQSGGVAQGCAKLSCHALGYDLPRDRPQRARFLRTILASALLLLAASCLPFALPHQAYAASTSTPVSVEAASDGSQRETGKAIVLFAQGTTLDEAGLELAASGVVDMDATALAQDDIDDGPATVVLVDGASVDDALEVLKQLPCISAAQPNYIYKLIDDGSELEAAESSIPLDDDASDTVGSDALAPQSSTNDEYISNRWALSKLDCFSAWNKAKCSHAVSVAVLDTGVRLDHEDLVANIDATHAYDAAEARHLTTTNTNYAGDPAGHGTHVAGIIAATAGNGIGIAGVSYNASIIPVKVMFYYLGGWYTDTETIIKAYEYLLDLVDTGKVTNLHVINMSLGGYSDASTIDWALIKEVRTALKDNIITVCAADNGAIGDGSSRSYENFDADSGYIYASWPSDYDDCISVCTTDEYAEYGVSSERASYSDWNEFEDISAPGTNIASTYICDSNGASVNNAYVDMTGTSMASPQVAGIVALMYAANPGATADQVRAALYASATDMTGTTHAWTLGDGSISYEAVNVAAGWDMYTGWGMANASAAIDEVKTAGTNIYSADVTGLSDQAYTGSAIRPAIGVSLFGKQLAEGTDYTTSYSDNIDAGTATVTITGIGNYCGTAARQFEIVAGVVHSRIYGAQRYATMKSIVANAFAACDTVVVARGDEFPDALAASALAGAYNAPIVLTDGTYLSFEASKEISLLGATKAIVIGGDNAISSAVTDELSLYGLTIVRVYGNARYDTAAQICESGKAYWNSTVIIASGTNFPDALAVSPFSYAAHDPIMLSDPSEGLSKSELAEIKSCGFLKAVIVGGNKMVPSTVAAQLKAAGVTTVIRKAGGDRYATAAAIAEWAASSNAASYGNGTVLNFAYLAVATGEKFPDALSGSALCGKNDGVLLLADPGFKSGGSALASEVTAHKASIREWHVLGGTTAVAASVYSYLENAIG